MTCIKIKKLLSLFLCLIVLLAISAPLPAFAQEQSQKVVRVGWYNSSFCYWDEFGGRIGVNVGSIQEGFLRDWMERNGLSMEIVPLDVEEDESLNMLIRGELDGYTTVFSFGSEQKIVPWPGSAHRIITTPSTRTRRTCWPS